MASARARGLARVGEACLSRLGKNASAPVICSTLPNVSRWCAGDAPAAGVRGLRARWLSGSSASAAIVELKVPALGESITDGVIATVLKAPGDSVKEDETIVQIETDKVTVDVKAPSAGVLKELRVKEDDSVEVGVLVALIDDAAAGGAAAPPTPPAASAPEAAPAATSVAAPAESWTLEVPIPQLGESITEGTVATVLKVAGDAVAEDETLVQVETDKVTVDVNSPRAGIVDRVLVRPDDSVEVGTVVAVIRAGAGAAAPAPAAGASPVAVAAEPVAEPAAHGRVPSIRFPPRRLPGGVVISLLPAAEAEAAMASLQAAAAPAAAAASYPPTKLQAAPPPQRDRPSPQANTAVWELSSEDWIVPHTPLSERDIELINLGGAEP